MPNPLDLGPFSHLFLLIFAEEMTSAPLEVAVREPAPGKAASIVLPTLGIGKQILSVSSSSLCSI